MRRRCAEKRRIEPDRKYNSVIISKFINKIMLDGKKSIAESICYTALEAASEKSGLEVLPFFDKVLENASPKRKIIFRRFGGSTYSIPKELKNEEKPMKAICLIVENLRQIAFQQGKKANIVLEDLLTQSFNNLGPVISAKDKIHKTAEANAAFAHFSW